MLKCGCEKWHPILPVSKCFVFLSMLFASFLSIRTIGDNSFAIWVKYIYSFLDIHQFLVYKIFRFMWTVVGTDMDDYIISLFLKALDDIVNLQFLHQEKSGL